MNSQQYNSPQTLVLVDKDNNRLEINAENLKLLRECSSEGFRSRALPLGLSFGFISYMIMKRKGILSNNFGKIPVILFSSVTGLIVGLRSYSSVCRERLMTAIKQNTESYNSNDMEYSNNQVPLHKDHEIFSQSKPTDIELPVMSNFDTINNNVDIDNLELPFESKSSEKPKHYTSYEDLREKNRREYYAKRKINRSDQEVKPNYNPLQPGYPATQTIYVPFGQFGNLKQRPAVVTQQPEYNEKSAN